MAMDAAVKEKKLSDAIRLGYISVTQEKDGEKKHHLTPHGQARWEMEIRVKEYSEMMKATPYAD